MCKVIAIVNQKGGVGKTTTAQNLASGLALEDKSVLAIDLDPQGNLTACFGFSPDEQTQTTNEIMQFILENEEDMQPDYGILYTTEGVDLIPANIRLATIEMQLITAMSREYVLKNYIERIRDNYDYILIDCPPTLAMLTINALAAADSVIIPVQAQHLAALGLSQLLGTVAKVRRNINRNLTIDGLIVTMLDPRTNLSRAVDEKLEAAYGNSIRIFKTKLPCSIKAAASGAAGESLFRYEPKCKLAIAYGRLTKELIGGADNE